MPADITVASNSAAVIATPANSPVVVIGGQSLSAIVANPCAQPDIVAVPTEQGTIGPIGPKGDKGDPGASLFYMAASTVSGHTGLMFSADGSGTVVPADPNMTPYIFAGISIAAAQPDTLVAAINVGLIVEPSWDWTPLGPIFVISAGRLTQSAPVSGVVHLVGFAVTAQSMFVDPQPPISII